MATNYEYFKDEIIDLMTGPVNFILGVRDGKPVNCKDVSCGNCDLYKGASYSCNIERQKWLNAEHIEKPKLTKKERQLCEFVETGWIARDEDGDLYYAKEKPYKDIYCEGEWITPGLSDYTNLQLICNGIFSFITWDDEKPWSVEELLKLECERGEDSLGAGREQ